MLRLLNAPGRGKDIYHYVVADGIDPRRGFFRFQFGDGEVRWTTLGRLEGAWRGAGHALLTVRPRESTSALQTAVDLENAGQLDAAEEEYRSIIEKQPDSVRAWVNLGNVRSRQGLASEAERAYRRALDLAPEDPDALNNLAWLLLEGGTALEEAESLARAAARFAGPDLPLVLDTLGRVLRARGQCREAEATFSEALELPGLSPALRSELEGARRELREDCRSLP
jgi:Tfp pilus assembly protein PilF